MAFQEITDQNFGIGHAIVTGKGIPEDYSKLRQACDLAVMGLTKGYPSLGRHDKGTTVEPEAYQRAGSPWSRALGTSVSRYLQSTVERGDDLTQVEPIKAGKQIALDTIVQMEAWQVSQAVKINYPTDFSDRLQEQYKDARIRPSKLQDLKHIAIGAHHKASPEAQAGIVNTFSGKGDDFSIVSHEIDLANMALLQHVHRAGTVDMTMYDEGATGIIQASRGEKVKDFDTLMSWYGYSQNDSHKLVEAAKIVTDIAIDTSPTQTMIGHSDVEMPPLERKVERAIQFHMDHYKPEDSVEKTTLGILAATEAQIAAHVVVDTTDNMKHLQKGFHVTRLSTLQNSAPQLFQKALNLTGNGPEYSDMREQVSLSLDHMSPDKVSDLRTNMREGANLSDEQRLIVSKRAAAVEAPTSKQDQQQQAGFAALLTQALSQER